MKQLLSIIPFLFLSFWAFAQDDHSPLIKGNDAYEKENFPKAEEEYLRAIEANPNSVKGHYNRGNAIYKSVNPSDDPEALKQRLDKAAESYLSAIENADDNTTKSKAYHNLGNTYMGKTEFDKGVEAYKNALRLNPKDMDTKANLQYALQQLQQQQQQQQQQGEGESGEGEQQEQENQEQQDPSENEGEQDQQKPSDQKEQDEPKDQEGGQSQAGEQEKQPTPEEMTKEEVLRQLKVMDEEEKKVQEKLKKEQRSEYRSEKDW